MEKIAVLLSAYNGEKYILNQIESIIGQKVKYELNLFIRDDGSNDNTVNVIQNTGLVGERIKLIAEENIGLVASFFKLIELANSLSEEYQYFSLADQDDVWDLDKLQIGIDAIKEFDKPALYASASRPVTVDLEPMEYRPKHFRDITFYNTIIQNFTPGHTYVMNRKLISELINVDVKKIYVHDAYILNVAVILGSVVYDDNPHVSYRQHQNNQLGTSSYGAISWAKNRIKRLFKGDGKQYARQIQYIVDRYNQQLNLEQRDEIKRFLNGRKNFITRILYITRTRLYRQRKIEDIVFKLLYLFGGYNVNDEV